jgi:phosphoglycolate phosphatase-like HAD superfamily hydrolase
VAVGELLQGAVSEQEVFDAYREVAGSPRQEVAQVLLERFGLENAARSRMDAYSVTTPWQAFVQIRMRLYATMLDDPLLIVKHRCPYSLDLLVWARETQLKTGLATSANCRQAHRVLQVLDITEEFDFVATGDDINRSKPDPEIYRLMAHELSVLPEAALVIEDSPAGVQAALEAGMGCVAAVSDFTASGLHSSGLLPARWIVEDRAELKPVVRRYITTKKA